MLELFIGSEELADCEYLERSVQFSAECDAVADGHLGDLQTRILGHEAVELQNVGPVVGDVLGYWSPRLLGHGAIPQSVVVADHSSHSHKLHQSLVVVQIVVFVRVHEDEVK